MKIPIDETLRKVAKIRELNKERYFKAPDLRKKEKKAKLNKYISAY